MTDHKNTILAIVLSAIVLIGWQYFIGMPQMEKQRQQQAEQQAKRTPAPGTQSTAPSTNPSAQPPVAVPGQPGVTPAAATPVQAVTRAAAIAVSPRVPIETPSLRGSIALKGGRIDDIALVKYRETVDPKSPAIVLLSPSGSPEPYYAEFGWVGGSGSTARLPDANTLWKQDGAGPLTATTPVTLVYDNGEGLEFRRTIAVDDRYMFTVKDAVANKGTNAVSLFPYALLSRHGTPQTSGYYILHEGLIGVFGDQGEQTETYKKIVEKKNVTFNAADVWLGFTDKYWAATLIPAKDARVQSHFSAAMIGTTETYQTDYLGEAKNIAPGANASNDTRLFAGAKEAATVGLNFPIGSLDGYNKKLDLNHFDLLIDWGWFYFVTKPMFLTIDFFYHLLGNFGIAILLVTVLVKAFFFPLANKSYASMAKMKAVQPQMTAIRERFGDDKVKQQQALMELYKNEKINPIAGCLPIVIQIPVFFALYKVLFITIEMRHAPFFGWIHDLAAPDPTNLFTLFGLFQFDPTVVPVIGHFLVLGVWPLIMGVTMFVQMKLNPAPPDPTQKMIFDWMPLIFTFMLASFPAGLVIYWAWNNSLSVLQQSLIMRKHGVKIELFDNLKSMFVKKKAG